jgi:hypothetical protein
VCTTSAVATEVGFRPLDLTNLGLVYSTFPKERKASRWI